MESLKQFRLSLGLSQQEMSDLLNVKQSTLSNYETGKRNPSLRACYKYIKIAKLRGIDLTIENLRPEI